MGQEGHAVKYDVKYPLPDTVAIFVAELRGRERSEEISSAQTNGYLMALQDAGWPLRAIANALNGVNVQAVNERISKGRAAPPDVPLDGPPIPEYPRRAERREAQEASTKSVKRKPYVVPDDISEEMRRLHAEARNVRGSTAMDSPLRQSSIKLTLIMHKQHQLGATFVELGRAAGVTYSAAKFRLGRYGFYDLPPSMVHTAMEDLSASGIEFEAPSESQGTQ